MFDYSPLTTLTTQAKFKRNKLFNEGKTEIPLEEATATPPLILQGDSFVISQSPADPLVLQNNKTWDQSIGNETEHGYRSFSINNEDSQIALDSLRPVFGNEFVDKVASSPSEDLFKKVEVETPSGSLELTAKYNSETERLFITVPDTSTSGTTMRIDFENGSPVGFASINDSENFIPELFSREGANFYSNLTGYADPKKFVSRFQGIREDEAIRAYLTSATADPSRREAVSQQLPLSAQQKAIFVPQGEMKITDASQALTTSGLNTCTSCLIHDPRTNKHALIHVDAKTDMKSLFEQVQTAGIDLKTASISVMEGHQASGAIINIFRELQNQGVNLDSVRFLDYQPPSFVLFPGLSSLNGQAYLDNQ